MSDFRIKYGLALGPEGNFQARTDNLLTPNSATPNVTSGVVWYSDDSSATTVTNYILTTVGPKAPSRLEGKVIRIFFANSATTLTKSSLLNLSSTVDNTFPKGSTLDLMFHNSAWYETGRSMNYVSSEYLTVNAAGSSGITIKSNTVTVNVIGTNATAILTAITGGWIGQVVNLVTSSSSGITIRVVSGGNLVITSDMTAIITTASSMSFVKGPDSRWYQTNKLW